MFENSPEISRGCLPKISEIYIIQNWRYPYIDLISVRNEANKQTHRHKRDTKYFGNSPEMSQKSFRKISHPELENGDIPILA